MGFAERFGLVPVRSAIQGRSLDQNTRNRLWSAFYDSLPEPAATRFHSTWVAALLRDIWADHLKRPLDSMPWRQSDIIDEIRPVFLDGKWYEVYGIIEFALGSRHFSRGEDFADKMSVILKQEMGGFSWQNGEFIDITDETELKAIEDAIAATANDKFSVVRTHITTATRLLSDRQNPDFRNSIKESISAVEAVVQILTGDSQAELGKALKKLKTSGTIHGALRSALLSLYGYTSDGDGIRHALTDEPDLDAADAKFMLVACAGFVVYLIQKSA